MTARAGPRFGSPARNESYRLERSNVFSLPAFWPFGHIELHGLAFLQALETARLDGREMDEYILASLTADEAVALGVVKPLYCSLFCHIVLLRMFLSINLR